MSQKPKATVVEAGRRFSFGRRGKLIAIIGLVVVAVGVGLWLWEPWHHETKQPTASPEASTAALNKAIDQYMASKDYKSAINLLKKQPGNNSQTQKLLAAAYANDKDYDNALATYKTLDEADNLSANDTATAAAVAERAQNYTLAIRYYKEAAQKAQAEKTPTYTDQVLMYNNKAKELQKKL